MRSLFNNRSGAAAVEMALLTPFLALLLVGFYDYGSYLADASAVEKGVRAGVMVAVRSPLPIDTATRTRIENVVKKGNAAGTGNFVVAGWTDASASVMVMPPRTESVGGTTIQVIRVQASVPYVSFLSGLMESVGLPRPTISAVHEQAYIGA
jgi:Flp pilus assembly protein TadG